MENREWGTLAGVAALMLLAGVFVAGGMMQVTHHALSAGVFFALALASFGAGMWVYYRPRAGKDPKCEKCGAALPAPGAACTACGHVAAASP